MARWRHHQLTMRYGRIALWIAAFVAGLLLIGLSFYRLTQQSDSYAQQALDSGSRAIILIEDGSILGAVSMQQPYQPETAEITDPLDSILDEMLPAELPDEDSNTPLTTEPIAAGTFGVTDNIATVELPANRATPPPSAAPVETVTTQPISVPDSDASTAATGTTTDAQPSNSAIRQAGAQLVPAPQPDLSEDGPEGTLPVAASIQRSPWRVYGGIDESAEEPAIALIIGNLGLGKFSTEKALAMPSNMTLAFSAYGRQSPAWVEKARQQGFEILLELPYQTTDYPRADPGPYALLSELSIDRNLDRLLWLLSRFTGYTGIITPPNDSFSLEMPQQADFLAANMLQRGLLYVGGSKDTPAPKVRRSLGELVAVDATLDDRLSDAAIITELERLADIARRNGTAVGLLRPYPLSMQVVQRWLDSDQANARQIKLVSLSTLVAMQNRP